VRHTRTQSVLCFLQSSHQLTSLCALSDSCSSKWRCCRPRTRSSRFTQILSTAT
jgi:hypothetical protein